MPKKTTEKLYSVSEAAKLRGVSRQAIHDAVRRGIIVPIKGGTIEVVRVVKTKQRGLKIPESELRKYKPDEMHMWVGRKKNGKPPPLYSEA